MIELDRPSLDRILPATPGVADWDDVLSRCRGHQGRRRRRLVMLAAAALVAVVGTASAFSTVREFILDRGFIGLPPQGATPSAPESGELVLRWLGDSATHATPDPRGFFNAPYVQAWVYADGRMIWQRDGQVPEGANELTSGYLEQRLTPEGVELLRSEVVGLLDRSRALLETVPADDDPTRTEFGGLFLFVPLDYPSWRGSVEVRDGDRLVRLQWRDVGTRDSPNFEGTIATPEQLSALRRIDALLTDPASVLPSSAWAVREVRAYVPSHYAVCLRRAPPKDASMPSWSHLLSLLPARAADVLRDKSRTRHDGATSVNYCSKLTTEEAREVANAVSGLERAPWPSFNLVYRVAVPETRTSAWAARWGVNNWISFDPYLPDGQFLFWGGGR